MGMDCTACMRDNAYLLTQAIHIFINPRVKRTSYPPLPHIPAAVKTLSIDLLYYTNHGLQLRNSSTDCKQQRKNSNLKFCIGFHFKWPLWTREKLEKHCTKRFSRKDCASERQKVGLYYSSLNPVLNIRQA